jgi:uncharacterized protein (DUF302 family)
MGEHKTYKSSFGFDETLERLEAAVGRFEMTIFSRIDHAAGAEKAGMKLRPTVVFAFGNPASGTPLMQQSQAVGIDLPLKALVWQDEGHAVWLSLTNPLQIAACHGLAEELVHKMNATIELIAVEITTLREEVGTGS